MKKVTNSILRMIGNTPLIKIGNIYAKLETVNPTGSIKDRIALFMMDTTERKGILKRNIQIIEATSGNTGISFSFISSLKNYKFTAIVPENTSKLKIKMMQLYGANIIFIPKEKGMKGTLEALEKFKNKKEVWIPNQFENPDNIRAHEITTGKEILRQLEKTDIFVSGIGTGGTIIGIARTLKKVNPKVKIIGIEPKESPILTKGISGRHAIEGIGEGFIPKILKENLSLIDEIITIRSREAKRAVIALSRKFGILGGISSGANILGAMRMKRRYKKKNVITVIPDRGERYLESLSMENFINLRKDYN